MYGAIFYGAYGYGAMWNPGAGTTYVLASDFADRRPTVSIADRRSAAIISDLRSASEINQP